MQIEGLIYVVTGGASGLGKQTVCSLVENGAFVSIFDVDSEAAKALAQKLGPSVFVPGQVDVTKEDQVEEAITATMNNFKGIILGGAILCSGILFSPSTIKGYGPNNSLTSFGQFEHIVKVNLLGTFCVAQKIASRLLKNEPMGADGERGIIITTSSITGLDGVMVAYGTSKAGIAGLTLPLARELAPFGIRITSIAPGPCDTPMVSNIKLDPTSASDCIFPKRYCQPNEFSSLALQIIKMPMLNGGCIRLDGALRACL